MRDQVVETKRVTRPNRVSTDGIYLAYVSEIMLFRVRTQMKRMLNTSLKPVYWPNSIAGNLSFYKSIKLYFFRLNYIIENKLLLSQFFPSFVRCFSLVEPMCTRIRVSFVTHQQCGMQLLVHLRRVICIFLQIRQKYYVTRSYIFI